MGYKERKEELGLTYGIIDKPNWFSSIFFGCQVRYDSWYESYNWVAIESTMINLYFSIFWQHFLEYWEHHLLLLDIFVLVIIRLVFLLIIFNVFWLVHLRTNESMLMLSNQKLLVQCFSQQVLQHFYKVLLDVDCLSCKVLRLLSSHQDSISSFSATLPWMRLTVSFRYIKICDTLNWCRRFVCCTFRKYGKFTKKQLRYLHRVALNVQYQQPVKKPNIFGKKEF